MIVYPTYHYVIITNDVVTFNYKNMIDVLIKQLVKAIGDK